MEHEFADVWGFVSELVDEELDFVKDTDIVLLVLYLEVAVTSRLVDHVNHVLVVDQLGKLLIGGSSSPGTIM